MAETSTAYAQRPMVVFDGDCRFCRARVNEIKKLDTACALDYIPRQEPACEERFPQVRGIPLDDGILFIEPDGRIYIAADAIYQIARRLPRTRSFAWIYRIPILKQIFQLGYRLVAINRRRLGQTCENNVCSLDIEKGARK